MTAHEMLFVVLSWPFAVALGAWLGRKYQRSWWMLDRPYAERVAAFCRD